MICAHVCIKYMYICKYVYCIYVYMYYITLCHITSYYNILYDIIWYSIILYYIILYYIILYYIILYYIILYCIVLYCIVSYCIMFYYIILFHIILLYSISYYNILCSVPRFFCCPSGNDGNVSWARSAGTASLSASLAVASLAVASLAVASLAVASLTPLIYIWPWKARLQLKSAKWCVKVWFKLPVCRPGGHQLGPAKRLELVWLVFHSRRFQWRKNVDLNLKTWSIAS